MTAPPPGQPVAKTRGEGPIAWMARNPMAVNLLMLILLGGGIWSALRIQKEVYPPHDLDVVEVYVRYPGAAPSEVEQGILLPIEEISIGLQGIKEMSSRAYEGSGRVRFELVPGTDRMKAYQDIEQAINREKQIKGWVRQKKNDLINEFNEKRVDLFSELE